MTKKNMKAYALIIIALLVVAICVVFAMQHRESKSSLSAEGVKDTVSEITQNTQDTKESVTVAPIVLTQEPKETKPADTEIVTDEEGTTKYVQQNVPQDVTDVYVTDQTEVTPQEDTLFPEEEKEPEQTTQTTEVTTEPKPMPVKTNSLGLPVTAADGTEMVGNDGNLYWYDKLTGGGWQLVGDGGGAETNSQEEQEWLDSIPHEYID